ncbi:unnamed protein product [Strongylus vulgaris]|uniref:PINIT domain-containing protein n=1 Tax=Strongylus vulgaris TaxID=40348 RepID=A0A3P7IEB3_STRVU|nr:unnamed protein product [Strongylus vulgaris]
MQSNAIHQQARILRNFVPIPLPFYDWHKTVLEPMELPPILSGVKTPCKALIPTNKPNVEPKRPSRPVDITQYCLNVRDHTRPMRLMVEWTGDKRAWAVAIYLVYRITSEILRDRATGAAKSSSNGDCTVNERPNHRQEESITRDVIRARLGGGNDDDIAMDQLKISLLCPVRIAIKTLR